MSYDTITIPSQLNGFVQDNLPGSPNEFLQTVRGRNIFTIRRTVPSQYDPSELTCPECGCCMHSHGTVTVRLARVPLCSSFDKEEYDSQAEAMVKRPVKVFRTELFIELSRYRCPGCGKVVCDRIPFKAWSHRITTDKKRSQ